jgi:hypothetical protein
MAERKTHVTEDGKLVPDKLHHLWHCHPAKIREDHKEQIREAGSARGYIRKVKAVLNTKKAGIQWLEDYAAGLIEFHRHPSGRSGQWAKKDPYQSKG